MRTHEAGRVIALVGFFALYGEMNLILTETPVNTIDGLHQPLLSAHFFYLVGSKDIQLDAVGTL